MGFEWFGHDKGKEWQQGRTMDYLNKYACWFGHIYLDEPFFFFMGNRDSPSISRNQVFHKYTHLTIREIGI